MKIHYFQRYHGKDNVDTSNAMLMLSRLYNYSSDEFYTMLNNLILRENDTPEISFDLQVVGNGSTPDAIISQKSFKIVVETKLDNHFRIEQLMSHLNQFGKEDIKVLLTLDPRRMKESFKQDFEKKMKEYNTQNLERLITPIKHVNITFEMLVNEMQDIVDERDTEILAVLEDYKKYCFDSHLIPDGYKWMRAIVVGTTLQDNLDLKLYYDKSERGYSEHGYIGLYKDKAVKAVGKLEKTILAVQRNGEIVFVPENGASISQDEKNRIQEAIRRSYNYGYNLENIEHRYFIVEKFIPVDFKKTSKNAIQKSKLFNLAEMFGYKEMPDIELIAKDLDGRKWEEF